MSGNIELAIAVFLGLWLGRSATISDYGAKIHFDIIGWLIDKGINTDFKVYLFGFALGFAATAVFGISFMSIVAFILAGRIGELSVFVAKERYLPVAADVKLLPEVRQVSLFDYHEKK